MALGDKVDELTKLAAILTERLDHLRKEVEGIHAEQDETTRALSELKTRFAVVDERLTELKKGLEESARRRWAILPSVVGGIIGAVLGFLGHLAIRHLSP
jgi:uncharacterized coiled-coil DUF342 family protein